MLSPKLANPANTKLEKEYQRIRQAYAWIILNYINYTWIHLKWMNEWMDEWLTQSIKQSIDQSINQSTNRIIESKGSKKGTCGHKKCPHDPRVKPLLLGVCNLLFWAMLKSFHIVWQLDRASNGSTGWYHFCWLSNLWGGQQSTALNKRLNV